MEKVVSELLIVASSNDKHRIEKAKSQVKESFLGSVILQDKIKGQFKHVDALYLAGSTHTKVGRQINDFIASSPRALAIMYRVQFLKNYVMKYSNSRIASFACGSCLELELVMKEKELNNFYDCYDVDDIALLTAERRGIKNMKTIKKNVITQPIWGKYNLIYTSGLFDYLKDNLAKRILKKFFECLEEGGHLIIDNVTLNPPYKDFATNLLEWELIHRSKEMLASLAEVVDADLEIKECPFGVFNYLILKKRNEKNK